MAATASAVRPARRRSSARRALAASGVSSRPRVTIWKKRPSSEPGSVAHLRDGLDGFLLAPREQVELAEQRPRLGVVRADAEQLAQRGDGLLGEGRVGPAFGEVALERVDAREDAQRAEVVFVDAQRGLGLALGLRHVVEEEEGDFGERGVRLGERGVEFRGLAEGGLRALQVVQRELAGARRGVVALAFEQFGVGLRAALARRLSGLRLRRRGRLRGGLLCLSGGTRGFVRGLRASRVRGRSPRRRGWPTSRGSQPLSAKGPRVNWASSDCSFRSRRVGAKRAAPSSAGRSARRSGAGKRRAGRRRRRGRTRSCPPGRLWRDS